MNRGAKTPRGASLQARTAGRGEEPPRGLSRREYHSKGDRARGPHREYLKIRTAYGEKVAGVLEYRPEGVVLVKKVKSESHQVRLPRPAWAIDCSVLDRAAVAGAERVEIHDKSTGSLWWSRRADFEDHGEPLDRGWGAQVALDLSWWSFLPRGSKTLEQLGLFGSAANG